jgi:PAS domain S-box-containing protein
MENHWEKWFHQMVESAPVMMWMSGPNSLCTYFNKRWLEWRGRRLQQELGEGWTEGVHPEDLDRCLQTYRSAFEARERFEIVYRLMRADGQYCWIVDSGSPMYDAEGKFAGYIGCGKELDGHPRISEVAARAPEATKPLSDREKQVLVLIAQGLSTKQIAATLGISYKTADSHRTRLMEKLAVHETASVVRYAIRAGLIEP